MARSWSTRWWWRPWAGPWRSRSRVTVDAHMFIRQLMDLGTSTWTYLVADDVSGKAMLIDPVYEHHARDVALLRELGLEVVMTVDTHCHADHVTGAWLMKVALGSRIALSARYGAENVDVPLSDGDLLHLG